MRKYGVTLRKQLWMAFPRVLLALLIGITIARPLELKIFEKEIDVKVMENRHKKILANDSLLQVENKATLFAAEQERGRLENRKSSIEDTLHRLQDAYVREADGTGGSLQRGINKLTLLKQQAYNAALQQFSPELLQLGKQIGYQDSILNEAKAGNEIKRKQYAADVSAKVGFLERNKALSDLSNQESSVFWANLLVSLLIILIEIGPVLSKLIMSVGPYDIGLAKMELLQMANAENDMRKDKELKSDKMSALYEKKKRNFRGADGETRCPAKETYRYGNSAMGAGRKKQYTKNNNRRTDEKNKESTIRLPGRRMCCEEGVDSSWLMVT